VKRIFSFVKENRSELVEKINRAYAVLAWENRYTLHPRRLREMGDEEIDCLLRFLEHGRPEAVTEHGEKRAREGLSPVSVFKLGEILGQFCFESYEKEDFHSFQTALSSVNIFLSAYLLGYIDSRERQILKDQEQLRIALSTALERQRKELYVKNHAIHTSINGIVIADLDAKITYVNPAFLKMWDYGSEDEVLNTALSELLDPQQAGAIETSLKDEKGWQGEITCRRQSGEAFDVAISASLILDESDNPVGIMTSLIDVTQRHHLEAQFRQAQKMEALGQLAGGIVHDFNNLLTAISGYAQLELMDLPKDSPQYNDFLQIKTATDRGMDLTQELRMFTRQASSDMEPLNPNDVIEETFNILKRTFPPEIKIELNLDRGLKTTKANPSQIIQMLMNLCVNARDAIESKNQKAKKDTESESPVDLITIQTNNVELNVLDAVRYLNARPGQYVCITVQDTGIGMSSKIMDRLFEPFFTTKGEKRGTGLGLAVVYGIVQNHSGFIDVRSQMGEGSTFKIYLPVLKDTRAETRATAYSPNLTSGKGTVLVADDDKQVKDMVLRALEKSGYSVISAENGFEAMLKYKANREIIDLVVLDMIMPQMSGRDCLLHLREINPAVKVLIMTGYTTNGSAEDLLQEGATGVIRKPFELQAFTEAVQKAISDLEFETES
jgi:two-component system cell cycle sensor histidine kinase/response regulator CckA